MQLALVPRELHGVVFFGLIDVAIAEARGNDRGVGIHGSHDAQRLARYEVLRGRMPQLRRWTTILAQQLPHHAAIIRRGRWLSAAADASWRRIAAISASMAGRRSNQWPRWCGSGPIVMSAT